MLSDHLPRLTLSQQSLAVNALLALVMAGFAGYRWWSLSAFDAAEEAKANLDATSPALRQRLAEAGRHPG